MVCFPFRLLMFIYESKKGNGRTLAVDRTAKLTGCQTRHILAIFLESSEE
jgi:hypothetical protein